MNKKQIRAAKLQRQQALVDAAKAAKRSLTQDEQNEFDTLQREIETLNTEIAAEEAAPTTGTTPTTPTTSAREAEPTPTPAPAVDEAQRAVAAERTRISEISSMCRDFGIDAQQYIQDGSTVDAVRAAILTQLRSTHAPVTSGINITGSGEDEFRADASDGLLLRGGLEVDKPSNGARQFAGMSLRDLAIECLERSGVSAARRMSSDELFSTLMQRQYYNPTAAFPAILDNAVEKAYVEGHRTAAVTFDRWTRKGSLKDFKIHDNNYIAGPVGDFLEVPEGGELKNDKPTDAHLPVRRIKTYGKQFTLSRQAFINDDIDLVTRIPARYAAAARRTINTQCYKILLNNPNIYDGTALFSSAHSNLLTAGTGITRSAVQNMILALSTQKDEFDQPIIVRPGAIIVPAGLAFDVYTLFNSPYIETSDNTQAVNPIYNQYRNLEIIEDPTINALAGGFGNVMPWFMTANSADSAFIEVDYLNGQEIPNIRRMETPGQLGFVWDIYLDWGINVMDYRGCIKNPGVAIDSPLGTDETAAG
ncbi:MAG: hypothetical protein LUG55_08100 [Clostridiales bacterium]|nr:hypothetical protein [Clostridiales bacterium]